MFIVENLGMKQNIRYHILMHIKIYQPMFCEALQTTTVSYIVGSNVTIKVECYIPHIYFLENILV